MKKQTSKASKMTLSQYIIELKTEWDIDVSLNFTEGDGYLTVEVTNPYGVDTHNWFCECVPFDDLESQGDEIIIKTIKKGVKYIIAQSEKAKEEQNE